MIEKTVEIDLIDKYDLVDKYNEKKLSNEILEYIIKQAMLLGTDKKIKVVINKKCHIGKDITKLIKEGLKEKYNISLQEYHHNNRKQVFLIALGILFIFLSTLIPDEAIWNEILLIIGWVPIWESIEVELFSDVDGRRKRKIIKKLLKSEIVEKSFETVIK